ncbi:RNA polymerase II transcription factor B p38 subunit [Hyphodiscus hymeniophilus]|uniref:RNA polymerase II transcription factor B subunit 3 n=1 Tax=Hyphodiscus hymeniophilus TaxID=353542 RepID=A0A9P6VDZ6_9HELO|nr:RNA polymerase II transcription factor B p38 subunit [Hyphodiscus hymeniophilus]
MSRLAKPSSLEDPTKDICPVCKSNRYLNPSLQFLINPECYHRMCSTCVDRIFTSGPASCPVPHCGKTLRKKGFHAAFFGDLKIEREVDVRKRVGKVFNRRQDEFETLLDWNNYLEEVEGLVFDIVEGSPKTRAQAEERLKQYREGNEAEIEENRLAALDETEQQRRREKSERDALRQRRLAELREEEEVKMDVAQSKREVLNRLANEDIDAETITKQAQKVILKKTSARRNLADQEASVRESLTIRGLKKKEAPVKEEPYDAFGGMNMEPTKYVLQHHYDHEWLDKTTSGPLHTVGGWDVHDYYARTMFEAFSGLGVFIEDEVADREPVSTAAGTVAATDRVAPKIKFKQKIKMESDDVF